MKTVIAILVLVICFTCCKFKAMPQNEKIRFLDNTTEDSSDYHTVLEPLFRRSCSPCHFPGGKMYTRMPFDQDSTIIHHRAGIFRRISKPAEQKLILEYIEQKKELGISN